MCSNTKHSIKLIEPSMDYEDNFKELVSEYKKVGEKRYFEKYKKALEDFPQFISELEKQSKGLHDEDVGAKTTTYWLTDEDEILGVIRIRHVLNSQYFRTYVGHIGCDISPKHRNKGYGDKILNEGLHKAKEIGLNKILITCVSNNIGSIKVIEKNGGIFESEVYNKKIDKIMRRYWVEI